MERPPCLRLDKFSQLAGLPRPTILEALSWEICLIRPPANSKRLQTGEREPVTSQPPCCRTAPCSWLAAKSQEYFVVSAGRPWFPLLRQSCSTAAQRRFLLLLACPFPDFGHTATLLVVGQVLVAGGGEARVLFCRGGCPR